MAQDIVLSELSTEAHADAMIEEFAMDGSLAWADDAMKDLRLRLIAHLDAAEQRGKDIRESFLVD
jgi:hypothetical protein